MGEIVTARNCQVETVKLAFPEFENPSCEFIDNYKEFVPDLESVLCSLPRKCKMDDALDAFAAAWTAKRYVRGKSVIIGGRDYDKHGYPLRVII